MQRATILSLACVMAVFGLGCWGGPTGPTVHRVAVDEQIDIGDQWNDVDSQLVSKEMIGDLLSRTWLDEWSEQAGRKPRLVVGRVLNKSHDHIPTDTFVKDLERELINSGEVDFVASHGQRGQLTQEKLYQASAASLESQKAIGRELGADFLVVGQINSLVNHGGGQTLKYYQVELEAINIETGVKVWMGQKKIKKLIERSEWDM
jgi:PBP1b-binding outer membrane lipoprotein LpoB